MLAKFQRTRVKAKYTFFLLYYVNKVHFVSETWNKREK